MFGAGALVALLGDVLRHQEVRGGQIVGRQPVGPFDGGAQVRADRLLDRVGDLLEPVRSAARPPAGRRSQIMPKPIPPTFREAKSSR